MKKLFTLLLLLISLGAYSQIDTATSRRTTVPGFAPKIITDAHLRAASSLSIPFVNSATPSMNGAINRQGYGLQLLSNGRLAIGLGSSTFAQYLNTTEIASIYQTIANISADLTASAVKYPSVNAVNTGLALKANLAGGNTFTGTQTMTANLSSTSTATTQAQADSTTKIANTAWTNREFDIRTGWASYADNVYTVGSPFSVAAGVTSTLPNNAATVINSQLPTGVTSFYNSATSKITPQNNGDYYAITVRFKAKNTETQGGYFDFGLDIGGSLGIIFKESKLFVKGANTEQDFVLTCNGYTAATFVANGGIPKITGGNGTTTIYNIEYQISRTHRAK